MVFDTKLASGGRLSEYLDGRVFTSEDLDEARNIITSQSSSLLLSLELSPEFLYAVFFQCNS